MFMHDSDKARRALLTVQSSTLVQHLAEFQKHFVTARSSMPECLSKLLLIPNQVSRSRLWCLLAAVRKNAHFREQGL